MGQGGSLKMWREYFGDQAIIYGIDIADSCIQYDGKYAFVRVGDASDYSFLDNVIEEMGGVDIVIDDGSHHMVDIKSTFEHVFPKINYGGLYLIEDLHTSFWRSAGGGFRSRRNFFRYMTPYIMEMHHWYHQYSNSSRLGKEIRSMHIYDSIAIFKKGREFRPTHSQTGNPKN